MKKSLIGSVIEDTFLEITKDRKTRKCLRCNQEFLSWGNHNRICYVCRFENEKLLVSSLYERLDRGE